MQKRLLRDRLQILQTISLIVGIGFTCYQVHNMAETSRATQLVNSANFVLRVSDEITKDKYTKLQDAIEDHAGNYKILAARGGQFTEHDIDDYISNFETLGNLANDDLISKDMVYNEMGYEIEKAWCNRDVYNFVQKARQADGNRTGSDAFYIGFEELAAHSFHRDRDKTCADLDKETLAAPYSTRKTR